MTVWRSLAGGVSALCIMTALPAHADVTPEQVWQIWKDLAGSGGATISAGSESRVGDTLSVRDVTVSQDVETGGIKMTLPQIDLRDRGDGTVLMTLPAESELGMEVVSPEGEKIDIAVAITHEGMQTIVSGSPEDLTYDASAAKLVVSLVKITNDGEPIDLHVDMNIAGLKEMVHLTGAETRKIEASFGVDTVGMTISAKQPEGPGTFDMTSTMQSIAGTTSATIVVGADMKNVAAELAKGFAVNMMLTSGAGSSMVDMTDERGPSHIESSQGGGSLRVALDKDRLNYGGSATDASMVMTTPDIPFPQITAKLSEFAFNLLMPVGKSDEGKDFGLLVKLVDLTVNDEIWGMIDPTAVLPHDPATLIVDLGGKARWFFDIFDPTRTDGAPPVPGEVEAVDLNALQVKVAGADLTGSGSVTIDNSDLTTYDGMPKPVGSVDLKLVGGNGLIDKLVQMGLLPEDQAAGARMMLGLFARPGDGEDTLVSKIEMTGEGAVLANGQRIK